MAIWVEKSESGNVLLRCDHAGGTAVEIPQTELPDAVRAMFSYLAWSNQHAALSLLREFKRHGTS